MPKLPTFKLVRDNVMIRGFSQKVRALAEPLDVRAVVAGLTFDYLDPAGREFTDIGNVKRHQPNITVRLDRQANPTAGGANLQVQVNDVALSRIRLNPAEGTTIAQVLVPASAHRAVVACRERSVQKHLASVVRSALLSSYDAMGWQCSIAEG